MTVGKEPPAFNDLSVVCTSSPSSVSDCIEFIVIAKRALPPICNQ